MPNFIPHLALAVLLLSSAGASIVEPVLNKDQRVYEDNLAKMRQDMGMMFSIPRFSDFKMIHSLYQGSELSVFHVEFYGYSRKMFAVISEDDYGTTCRKFFESHYQVLKTRKVPYLETITDPLPVFRGINFNYCIVLGEWGEDMGYPIFTNTFEMKKSKNTEIFIKFIGRVVEGFAYFNSFVHMYHTNINEQSILGTWEGAELIPRITNLQHAFQMKGFYERANFRVYDTEHRPPEINQVAIRSVFPNEDSDRLYENYVYDLNFKEEAYALGVTLMDILENNAECLNPKSKSLEKVKKIIRMMLIEDPERRNCARKTLKLLRESIPKIEEITKPIFWVDSSEFGKESGN